MLEKILSNIEKLEQQQQPSSDKVSLDSRKLAIILGSGCFAPIHKAHVGMFDLARKSLEQNGYLVVGGIISPCCDQYVRYKLKKAFIPARHRLQMCHLAIAASDWLTISQWESEQHVVPIHQITQQLEHTFQQELPRQVQLFFMCGSDSAVNSRIDREPLGATGVIVIGRGEEYDAAFLHRWDDMREKKLAAEYLFCPKEDDLVSSTAVRKRIEEGKGFEDLTGVEVAKYFAAAVTLGSD